MGYKLSVKAEEDILNIFLEGVRLFGSHQAEKYHSDLERTFAFLAQTPSAARLREELSPPVRIHPFGAHLVVYLTEDSGDVLILRVRHGHEDWDSDPVG